MRKWGWIGLMAAAIAAAPVANAGILELRVGAGISSTDADSFENELKSAGNNGLESDDLETINVDAFINIPFFPIGAGLRYETASIDDSALTSGYELDVQNISLLVDYRLIDTKFYLGPIVSIGYPWAELDFKTAGANVSDQIDANKLSYSLAAEAGVNLNDFIIGAEAGYRDLDLDSDAAGLNVDVDLSGFYGKVMVGYGFF